MRLLRIFVSGKMTFVVLSTIAGVYLFMTFGIDNPLNRMVLLLQNNNTFKAVFLFAGMHFLFKGMYVFKARGRKGFASALFMLGLSVFITGIHLSVHFRDTVVRRTAEGEFVGDRILVRSIEMNLPEDLLILGEGADFTIKELKAEIEDGGNRKVVRPFPFVRTVSGFAYLRDAGRSPAVQVNIGGTSYTVEKLQLYPPAGKVSVPVMKGIKAELSFEHEKEFKQGRLIGKQFNLKTPRYRITLKNEKGILFDDVLHDGSRKEQNGIIVFCGTSVKWVDIVLVTDHFAYMMYAGLFGIFIGAALFPFEYYLKFRL